MHKAHKFLLSFIFLFGSISLVVISGICIDRGTNLRELNLKKSQGLCKVCIIVLVNTTNECNDACGVTYEERAKEHDILCRSPDVWGLWFLSLFVAIWFVVAAVPWCFYTFSECVRVGTT